MAKNILIFADGTGQAGGLRPDQRLSNVYKLYRATRTGPDSSIDPAKQVAFYDPGLGTITSSGAVRIGWLEWLKSVAGMAVGLGFNKNVIDCYEAILRLYQPGDRIYLFGFSRGGYTARAVANVINLCGVPTTDGSGNPLPRAGRKLRAIAKEAVTKVYGHGAGYARDKFEAEREEIGRNFRSKYEAGNNPDRGDVVPEFIGVFDSVAALGLPIGTRILVIALMLGLAWGLSALFANVAMYWRGWDYEATLVTTLALLAAALTGAYAATTVRFAPKRMKSTFLPFHFALWHAQNYDRYLDKRVPRARHALAIDESRKHFSRVGWGLKADGNEPEAPGKKPRFVQTWFAGNHSDIGGSYLEEESRLSDIALSWMLDEVTDPEDFNPIIVDHSKLHLFPDPLGPQHCEHFSYAQAHPWLAKLGIKWPRQDRQIPHNAPLHRSVLNRFKAAAVQDCANVGPYRPKSLRQHDETKRWYDVDA